MPKIRTEITIESTERLTVKRKRHSTRRWCNECERISIMVLPTEAAFLACADIDSIIALMYSGRLHVHPNAKHDLYICVTSLCEYPYESEFEDSILENKGESIKILADSKTKNYSFVHEDYN